MLNQLAIHLGRNKNEPTSYAKYKHITGGLTLNTKDKCKNIKHLRRNTKDYM